MDMDSYLTKNAQSIGTVNGMSGRVNHSVTFACCFHRKILKNKFCLRRADAAFRLTRVGEAQKLTGMLWRYNE